MSGPDYDKSDARLVLIESKLRYRSVKEYRQHHQEGQSREIMGTGNLVPGSHLPAW